MIENKETMIKSEEGSIIVESSFVFPIIIITVLVLMTFVLYYHDQIMIQLSIDSCESMANSKEELSKVVKRNTFLQGTSIEVSEENGRIQIKQENILSRIRGDDNYEVYYTKGVKKARIYKILFIEKIEDYIEMITMDLLAKIEYDELLKQILSRLKTN